MLATIRDDTWNVMHGSENWQKLKYIIHWPSNPIPEPRSLTYCGNANPCNLKGKPNNTEGNFTKVFFFFVNPIQWQFYFAMIQILMEWVHYIFYTWLPSCMSGYVQKICSNITARDGVTVKQNFSQIWIMTAKNTSEIAACLLWL